MALIQTQKFLKAFSEPYVSIIAKNTPIPPKTTHLFKGML
jgi:hypothetical protein